MELLALPTQDKVKWTASTLSKFSPTTIQYDEKEDRYRLVVNEGDRVLIDRYMHIEDFNLPYVQVIIGTIKQMREFIDFKNVKVNLFRGERMFVEEALRFMEGRPMTFDIQLNTEPLKGK